MQSKEYIKRTILTEVLLQLDENGLYFCGGLSLKKRRCLIDLIKASGYEIYINQIPPEWEYVIYTPRYTFIEIVKVLK